MQLNNSAEKKEMQSLQRFIKRILSCNDLNKLNDYEFKEILDELSKLDTSEITFEQSSKLQDRKFNLNESEELQIDIESFLNDITNLKTKYLEISKMMRLFANILFFLLLIFISLASIVTDIQCTPDISINNHLCLILARLKPQNFNYLNYLMIIIGVGAGLGIIGIEYYYTKLRKKIIEIKGLLQQARINEAQQ